MEWYINVNNCVVVLYNFHTRLHIITLSCYISVVSYLSYVSCLGDELDKYECCHLYFSNIDQEKKKELTARENEDHLYLLSNEDSPN